MEYLEKLPKQLVTAAGFVLVLLFGLVDYLTGPQISFSIFYLLPIALVTWEVGGRSGVLISIASAIMWLIADLVWAVPYGHIAVPYWNALMRLALFLIVVYLLSALKELKENLEKKVAERTAALTTELSERKRVEEEIRMSREQLRQLAAKLEMAREEERMAVSREIHDELGQTLTGLRMDLSWLESNLPEEGKGLRKKAEAIKGSIDSMLKVVRRISAQLRPGVLDHLGLVAALEWQAQEFQKRTGIRCIFTSDTENAELDENCTTAVFRIYLEALTNVARHARATDLGVYLNQKDSTLILKVTDNGRGISDLEISNPRSLGLLGMKERALLLGGKVEVRGSPGAGTTLTLTMPLDGIVGKGDQP